MAKRKTNTKKIEAATTEIEAAQSEVADTTESASTQSEVALKAAASAEAATQVGQLGDYKPIPRLNSRCKGCL